MTRPFQPANGTDGFDFMALWCARCQCEPEIDIDDDVNETPCVILTESFALKVTDEGYPPELIEDAHGCGRCTAFIERTHPGVVAPRQVAKDRARYQALPRDPKTGRPVIA